MRFQTIASLAIDNRADMGFDIARVADMEFAGGSRDHLNSGDPRIVLDAEQPQRRTALTGGAKRGNDHIIGYLFGKSRGVDDHCIDTAGLGDQWDNGPGPGGQDFD